MADELKNFKSDIYQIYIKDKKGEKQKELWLKKTSPKGIIEIIVDEIYNRICNQIPDEQLEDLEFIERKILDTGFFKVFKSEEGFAKKEFAYWIVEITAGIPWKVTDPSKCKTWIR